jgi:D-methionine transport system substrate-binding protein
MAVVRQKAKKQLIALIAILVVVAAGIGGFAVYRNSKASEGTVVTVGVVGNADDAIWKAVQSELDSKDEKIKIQLKPFQDGIYTNQALANKELNITAFQHYAFLNQEVKQKGYKFSVIGESYISPMNLYSSKYKSVDEFKDGDKIAIPNNATNTGRALKVLAGSGLIGLKDPNAESPTIDDVTENKHHVRIELTDAAAIVNLLPDYAGGITNTNFILDAGKSPDDAIYKVTADLNDAANKPYINVIVANSDDKDNPVYRKIVDAYHTKTVADAINANYKGAVIPAFKY